MLRERFPETLARAVPRVVFCAGFFDGVHVGHRALLAAAVAEARARHSVPAVLTMDPHPLAVLRPDAAPALVVPETERRLALLSGAGMEACLLLPFTRETAATSPEDFVRVTFGPWLRDPDRSCFLVCGPNWRFGAGRAGTPEALPALSGGRMGVRVEPLAEAGGAPVSSSRVRVAIRKGDVALAAALLGRPWETPLTALGAASGRGVGTRLGAPTANAFLSGALRPACGVYALDVRLAGEDAWRRAVANYGFRPTFPDARPDEPLLEIHLLGGFEGDLHGRRMDVRWLARIRDERAFSSPAALAAQIKADVSAAADFGKSGQWRRNGPPGPETA